MFGLRNEGGHHGRKGTTGADHKRCLNRAAGAGKYFFAVGCVVGFTCDANNGVVFASKFDGGFKSGVA